jgi:sialate O-acetylesterase
MLAEIAPVSLTAVLFYQGEEDASRTDCYDVLMTAMIRYWRILFRSAELPFLFVQLPMWLDNGAEDTFQWPKTRLAQAAVRDSVRNTGMICLLDEGEYGNIHPVNKQPVGIRLAELAERMIYHGTGEVSPRAVGRFVRGNTMIVVMSAKVRTKDGEAPRLLEIAGEDGKFVPAEGEVEEGVLRIRAEQVKHPAAVRYAWCDWSDRVNLTGENGLPLEPFAL